jgi:alpha-L-arabinofuranosidase
MSASMIIDTTNVVRSVEGFAVGVNLAAWDYYLSTDPDTGLGITPDPQTITMLQDAGFALLRLSNGSGADEWHFSSDSNATPISAGLLANAAAALGVDGLVTVNYGTGTPQEAAAYLAYLNGAPDNTFAIGVDSNGTDWGTVASWAQVRAAIPIGGDPLDMLRVGRAAPFAFGRFEVGNEIYFAGWSGAPASVNPSDYVNFAQIFAGLAGMIDPSASIGIGLGNPIEWDELWNIPVLQQCQANGFTPGFISDHFYVYDGSNETLTDMQLLRESVNDPTSVMPIHASSPRNWAGRAIAYRTLLTNGLGAAGAAVELVCAEFNSDSDAANKQSTSLIRGLFMADAIGAVLQTEYSAVVYWDMRNSYTDQADDVSFFGWRTGTDDGMIGTDTASPPVSGPYVPYPAYFGIQLATNLTSGGGNVISVTSDTDRLSAYAVKLDNGHLTLLVINKSLTTDFTATIAVDGLLPTSPATAWTYGRDEDLAQKHSTDGNSSVTTTANLDLDVMASGSGGQFNFTFNSYSMVVFDIPLT